MYISEKYKMHFRKKCVKPIAHIKT